MATPPELRTTWAVFAPDRSLGTVDVTDDVYQRLEGRPGGFAGHVLIARHDFTGDWSTWEMHPDGDELVVLLHGRATFVLREDGRDRAVPLDGPGTFVTVPRGTWHTARIAEPTALLFFTPGAGTRNAERPAEA